MPEQPTKYDYLYERMGPWPQPSPEHPQGEAPSVVHVPKTEQRRWVRHIGLRYARQLLTYWPAALVKALSKKGYPEIDDARFGQLLLRGINTRYLVPSLDPPDQIAFAALLDQAPPEAVFMKMDLTPIAAVRPYPKMHVCPSVVLVQRDHPEAPMRVVAVRCGDVVLQPQHGAAWDLCKYFVLQAAAYGILFTVHPNLHFPFDTVNAVTKTALPVKHVIFKLLSPHLDFQLALNNAVLNSPNSIVSNKKWSIYDPFTARADDGLLSFFVAGYQGVPGNSAYPPYQYALRPKQVIGPYGEFLDAYYGPFYDFAKAVAAAVEPNDPLVRHWAQYIHMWIPGFPGADDIFVDDNLTLALAGFLWNVTIGHGTDHASYVTESTVREKCFRIRAEPPSSTEMPNFDPGTFATWGDTFRAYMAEQMFFRPHNVVRLLDVRYAFTDPKLIAAANRFFQDLREVEGELKQKRIPIYMPVGEIPASIQY